MPEKPKRRPLSASRQRRQITRRASLNADPTSETRFNLHPAMPNASIAISAVDMRTTAQKLADLKQEAKEMKGDRTPEEVLDSLVLTQLYTSFEYGDVSAENARAYLDLSRFYFDRKNFLWQAKKHALNARQVLEGLKFSPVDDNLAHNMLGFQTYLLLAKCSLGAIQHLLQREAKNKHITSIDTSHIKQDLELAKVYLQRIDHATDSTGYDRAYLEWLLVNFDAIVTNSMASSLNLHETIDTIVDLMDKSHGKKKESEQVKRKIDFYHRCGQYYLGREDEASHALDYYKRAAELAEKQQEKEPSTTHLHQSANALFQWARAKVRLDRLTETTEKRLQRAIDLFKEPGDQVNKSVLRVIDELATFYTKREDYQDALNILCESLPDKISVFGDFSEEVIQTRSRIGAIYLREGESLNAADHLKKCFDIQELVYGPKDPRTCQTRATLELLKKDPTASRAFFARTQDGILQDRPAFRGFQKVSYAKDDRKLLQTVKKKPPISTKT